MRVAEESTYAFKARKRLHYAMWAGVVVFVGIASRSDALALPPFLAKYAGDALWALMVFLAVAFLVPTWKTAAVAGLSATISCGVEFSQLYHAPWLDAVRSTTLGHLVLGDTFAWADIAAYLLGIAVGATVEWTARRLHCHRRQGPHRHGAPAMDDPFNLSRFIAAQEGDYEQALAEIRAGRKRTHWMWYIFPQLIGLGSSATAQEYAIKSAEEAKAYLAHSVLGPRLIECVEALLAVEGRSAHDTFGSPDDLKLRSCATLFANVSPPGSVFERLLEKYYDGQPDGKTLGLIGKL